MFEFGDAEPEDAWDPVDDTPTLLDNLRRRMLLLERTIARDFADTAELDTIAERLAAWRLLRSNPSDRDLERARQLDEDLDYVRARL